MGAVAVPIGVMAAGSVVQALGAHQEAQAQQAQSKYNMQVAGNNQQIANAQAQDILDTGRIDEETQRYLTAQRIGEARASAAARGVDVNQGSAVDIQSNLAATGEQEALTIRSNAAKQALAARQQAQYFGQQGQLEGMQKKQAGIAGNYGVAGSILGGATSVANRWYTR